MRGIFFWNFKNFEGAVETLLSIIIMTSKNTLEKIKDQSTYRYKNYNEWLHEYWLETIQLYYAVLEKGGVKFW